MMAPLELVVAMDRNRAIGVNNQLPWHLPEDLKHFKQLTLGNPIIMGRKTYASIGKALPGRHNIVLSRNPEFTPQDATVAIDLDAAIAAAGNVSRVFVIGGAQIYALALPAAQVLHITHVDTELDDADTWFPAVDLSAWQQSCSPKQAADDRHGFAFQICQYQRGASPTPDAD